MSNETILVVDDSQELADFTAHSLLPSLGYQAEVSYDGKTALKIIRSSPPALMLLDLEMPDITGLDLLRQLAKENITIPSILITAHGSEQVAVDAFRLGVHDYLTKPVEPEVLNAAITKALANSRLSQETVRLNAELKEQIAWLSTLAKTGQNVTSTLNLSQVLRRIVDAGVQLTQAEEGFLALLDKKSGQLFLRAVKSMDEENIKTMRLPVVDSLAGQAITSGKPLRVSKENSEHASIKVSTGFLVHSLIHVPILSKGQPLGVLSVDNRATKHPFTARDEEMLISLADYAAVAIENADLFQQAQTEIAERKRVEQALRESEDRYALAVQGANDGIWDWNLRLNKVYYSPRWKSMLGFTEGEIGDSPQEWMSRIHPQDFEKVKLAMANHLRGQTPHFESEHRMRQKDGSYLWMLSRGLAVRSEDGSVNRMAGSQADISIRKEAEARLQKDAFFDRLTGLPNRAYIFDRLKAAIEHSRKESGKLFAVYYLDLDQFKNINDRFGHPVGDQLLIQVGGLLKPALDTSDFLSRVGGDEFIVLQEELPDIEAVKSTAQRILRSLSGPIRLYDNDVHITASIGIVVNSQSYEKPEDILRDADIAMYAAKGVGKGTYQLFDPQIREKAMRLISLETDMRQAIEQGQFVLHFQPIFSLRKGRLEGLEALVRWQHPKRGLLMPGEFIPVAQNSGLILSIDRWVLEQSCHQLKAWQDRFPGEPPTHINVNITSGTIAQTDLVETIRQVLHKTGLKASCLKLEITESVVMGSEETVTKSLADLRQMGIELYIDDFGTGYSSLAYLQQIPVNALKIDRSFIHRLESEASQAEIIRTIVHLAHTLNMQAYAEGVETKEQLEYLKKIDCDGGQGYLLASPLGKRETGELLNKFFAGILPPEPWASSPSSAT